MNVKSIKPGDINGNYRYKTVSKSKFATMPENSSSVSLNSMPSAVIGKSLVSFGRIPFEQTVAENWFQLSIDPKTGKPFPPDEYQLNAAKAIHNGENHLVTAPTGIGKTAIAKYAISKNMEEGKKTFYTTPLKALSDQKFRELQEIWGAENVGLLTGDVKLNPKAPIVVMTTEIYHNMVFADKFKKNAEALENLGTVIFDEMHYMGDPARGHIWEESIILSPPNVQRLSLSATIGNYNELADWESKIAGKPTTITYVPPEKRPVPLDYHITELENGTVEFEDVYKKVLDLKKENKIPALFYVYSKKDCKKYVEGLKEEALVLNTPEEMDEVQKIIKRYEAEGKYLGASLDKVSLMRGYGIHNAGILPALKELVEELGQKKLLKVTFATDTMGAGINYPIKTTVFTSVRKPDPRFADAPDGKRYLMVNEFFQSAGRAGRRGIDPRGDIDVFSTSEIETAKIQSLINSSPDPVISHFNPDYSALVNYYDNSLTDEDIKGIVSKSFQAYDKDPEVAKQKTDVLFQDFMKKKSVLQDFGYINTGNEVAEKSKLLSVLNGYEQIPITDMIYNKKLFALTPAELAASVGSLSVTNNDTVFKLKQSRKLGNKPGQFVETEKIESESKPLNWFMDNLDETIRVYNNKRCARDKSFDRIAQNRNIALQIYDWAASNTKNEDSVANWVNLVKKHSDNFTDEGGLFRSITQASDLLKQIQEVAKKGLEIAKTQDDSIYYKELLDTAKDAVKLLARKPII